MASIIIEIINWDKHNPKRDQKTYTWLRLNNDITTDRNLYGLDPEQRYVWIALLCEASKDNVGVIEIDTGFLAHITAVSEKKILKLLSHLEHKGIIARQNTTARYPGPTSSTTPTNGRTDVTNETDERDETDAAALTPQNLFDIWNEHRGDLPAAQELTDKRRDKARSRIKERPDYAYWVAVVKALAESDFASGRKAGSNGDTWQATFNWLLQNGENHVKVSEGNYRNKKSKAPPSGSSDKISELERFRQAQREREVGT